MFLGAKYHALSMSETITIILQRIVEKRFTQHSVVNVAKIVSMQSDPVLRKSVNECDLINVDGMGVVWGGRLLGENIPERVAGIDLFLNLSQKAAEMKLPIFLLGAKEDIVLETKLELCRRFPELIVAGYHHGYFWQDEKAVVEKIKNSGARLLFVAITSPKKENFISDWKDELGVDFVMGVGGSFDVIAGVAKRAPEWIQKIGMEWFYRFVQEPRRMFNRAIVSNFKFLLLLLYSFFSKRVRREGVTRIKTNL